MIAAFKQFVPMKLLLYMKYFSLFQEKRLLPAVDGPCIFYLDAPDYGNLGDQAIALAIRQFAQREFPEYTFIEILQKDLPAYIWWLKRNIREKDMIFLTGGGNMGNLYRTYEAARRYVVEQFPNNKIVIFPQTIQYTQDFFGRESLKKSSRIYGTHKNLLLCAREEFSYSQMQSCYPGSKIVLCPDIVFSLQHPFGSGVRNAVGVCLRDDMEKKLSAEDTQRLLAELSKVEPFHTISTSGTETYYDKNNREAAVMGKLQEIASCKVLVTDRLHAVIFAALTNTPCVVIPNNNSKITGTMKWLMGNDSIVLFDSPANVLQAMDKAQAGKSLSLPNHSALLRAIRE